MCVLYDNDMEKVDKNYVINLMDLMLQGYYNENLLFYSFSFSFNIEGNFIDYDDWKKKSEYEKKRAIFFEMGRFEMCVKEIELIDFLYSTVEYNKLSVPSIKGIMGVRSITGKPYILLNSLKCLALESNYRNCQISYLKTFTEIKDSFLNVIKEFNWSLHYFVIWNPRAEAIALIIDYFHLLLEDECIQYQMVNYSDKIIINYLDKIRNPKFKVLSEIKSMEKNVNDETLIMYLVKIYLLFNQYVLNNNVIYVKVEEKYEKVNTLENLLKDPNILIKFFNEKFPNQVTGFNFEQLFNKYGDKAFNKLMNNSYNLPKMELKNK